MRLAPDPRRREWLSLFVRMRLLGLVLAARSPPQAYGRSDVERAKANYRELFGWAFEERVDLGSLGGFHPFAWQPGGAAVGSMSDLGQRPGVDAHWLFHFRVASLEPALDAVRAGGGVVIGPIVLPNGDKIAICDDPQGAAFALREGATSP